jgi:class I fructose-bisphosphate aldolase
LGALEHSAEFIKKAQLPTILKINNHDYMMADGDDPFPSVNAWVDDAVRLNCAAVGFTIYPGSLHAKEMYEQAREMVKDARKAGKVVVIWAYPRGSGLPRAEDINKAEEPKTKWTQKDIEVAVDVASYGVHIACQLGAHIVKCKPTLPIIALDHHRKKDLFAGIPIETLAERTELVIRAAFGGTRIVINSGGAAKGEKEVLEETRQLSAGGSFGSIVGRNSFQRSEEEGIALLHKIQDIHALGS